MAKKETAMLAKTDMNYGPAFGRLVGALGRKPARWEYRKGARANSRAEMAKALRWLRQVMRTDLF